MSLPVLVENNGKTTPGGVTGRGFVPGQTGNPGGRPKALTTLIREETGDGAELVEFFLAIFRGKRKAPLRQRIEAAEWLTDRGFGKAVQQMEVSGPERGPVPIQILYPPRVTDDDDADGPP